MIEKIVKKDWVSRNGIVNHYVKVAYRICDNCGNKDETLLRVLFLNRKKRKEDKDYCHHCAAILKPQNNIRGSENKRWKHGLTYNGYVRTTTDNGRVLEHVLVMSKHLGRPLNKGEIVHHIDLNKQNNKIENLWLFPNQSDHARCHALMESCACSLLGKLVWFDWETKEYKIEENSVIKKKPEYKQIILPDLEFKKQVSYGREYWFYKKKRQHVIIAELLCGRKLFRNEYVHHVDGDTLNNSLENLCILVDVEHSRAHRSLQGLLAILYQCGTIGFENGRYFVLKGKNNV